MSEHHPRLRPRWETWLVRLLWGTDGVERGVTLPEANRNNVFLAVALICLILVQLAIGHGEEAETAKWAEALKSGNELQLNAHWERSMHWKNTLSIVNGFNFLALVITCFFYRRRGTLGLWIGIGVSAVGTAIAMYALFA